MAHFTCNAGTRYYPFGRGGRENLLRGCEALRTQYARGARSSSNDSGSSGNSGNSGESASYLRLQHCPMRSFPIQPCDSSSGGGNIKSADIIADPVLSMLPIVLTQPESEAALEYRALANDVITEIFRNQVGALLVRQFKNQFLFSRITLFNVHTGISPPMYCRRRL